MKGRFPPDLFVVVLGPVLVALIVVVLGLFISHAEQLGGSVAAYGVAIVATVLVLGIEFFRRRRRQ
jgi:uncharacterized membrane protein YhhN